MIIMASLNAPKNACRGRPRSFILPMVVPSTMLNITMPNTFVVCVNWDVIFHSLGWTAAKTIGIKYIYRV